MMPTRMNPNQRCNHHVRQKITKERIANDRKQASSAATDAPPLAIKQLVNCNRKWKAMNAASRRNLIDEKEKAVETECDANERHADASNSPTNAERMPLE